MAVFLWHQLRKMNCFTKYAIFFYTNFVSYGNQVLQKDSLAQPSLVLHWYAHRVDWETLLCRCIFNKNSFTLLLFGEISFKGSLTKVLLKLKANKLIIWDFGNSRPFYTAGVPYFKYPLRVPRSKKIDDKKTARKWRQEGTLKL